MKLKLFDPKKDAFSDVDDAFSGLELPADEKMLLSPDLDAKIDRMVERKLAAALAALPKPQPIKETVKEVRVEVQKDGRDLVTRAEFDALKKENATLKKELEETDRRARSPIVLPGGSGVIGIPPPEAAAVDDVLTVGSDKKAKWKAGGGGSGLSGYTITAFTELKTFDPANTSLDEVARVLASAIEDLQ